MKDKLKAAALVTDLNGDKRDDCVFWTDTTLLFLVSNAECRKRHHGGQRQRQLEPITFDRIELGSPYEFNLKHVSICDVDDEMLIQISISC